MPEYIYKASDNTGKVVEGIMSAPEESALVAKLHGMGYIPIKVSPSSKSQKFSLSMKFSFSLPFGNVSGTDLLAFTQELSTLIKAGLPLDRSLSILVELTENEKLKEIVSELLKDIRGGRSFSDALAKHPRIFDRLYINMVKAGEAGGVLDVVLERLADFLDRSQQLKSTILNAMIYPIILICVMAIVIAVMLMFVIPRFAKIFEMMGKAIPLPTQILMSFSIALKSYWWLLAALGFIVYIAFRQYLATEGGRRAWDGLKLRLPVLRMLILKIEVARFSRTLGTLINSGVPLLQSLTIVKEVIKNVVVSHTILDVSKGAKEGKGVSGPLRSIGMFPPLAMHMIRVGEETGRLDDMLIRVADTYDLDIQNSVKRFISILEPLLILVMSFVVAFIVLSIISAILSINDISF
ncbi:MAG: type II secretion system F family protein [Proteobacteria bacterium]|nr:type II secretion system F family protein [Pseudomonadota bacterium]